ncbi:glycoside hydrolase/phage tail family protein [soil metagenome]
MAQVVLGGIGGALGGGVGRSIGAALGGVIDRGLISSLSPARQIGPRLETLKIQSSADGAPMACVFGRARVTGQVIWAARFLERRQESRGGKGGPRTVDYQYSLSFAVALCEGAIDGVGRVWADGQLLDLSGVTMRVHRGTEEQTPDPLIEAVEAGLIAGSAGGSGGAPAYRGTAYVVFEDLPLGPFGDRAPQLSFEVFRRPAGDGLEERLEGVCLIPGAGEFVLADEVVLRRDGLTRTTAENLHNGEGRPDLLVSLDQLEAQCPNLKRVSLVVGWFGDDLRAGHCRVRPGVERRDKMTEPQVWSVAGLGRQDAHLVSQVGGGPAYGGTPSDESVRQAVAALKARGWAVTLYPFVFMDIAADNDLPDPYGSARQAAYPWRGRIAGEDGAEAAAEVAAMFGEADDWGLRRLALHYAGLAAETGAEGLLIGSEMRGLTWTRDEAGGHPAVNEYRMLAVECRAILGDEPELSYAADWSEYFGFQPGDGSGDVVFHLDPLWADEALSHVAIDWYPPLGDWRSGDGGVDGEMWAGSSDPDYVAAQVAGGEGFDWYYAGAEDRAAQVRTAIVDGAYGEDWVFRPKDLVGWWSNAHHDRIGGVRSAVSTAWEPEMKPLRLTEFGCAAVDRGGNAPNLFQDPKSAESALPPHSTGVRDDRMQRRALEAVLEHFADPANNPVSVVYGGPMLDGADAWCWDARPYPAFPARAEVWADAGAWQAGHWLNGRLSGDAAHMLAEILRRGGVADEDFVVGPVYRAVEGFVIDRPMRTRDALAPLLTALGVMSAERGEKIALFGVEPAAAVFDPVGFALPDEGEASTRTRTSETPHGAARVRFIDEGADYQTGSVTVRSDEDGDTVDLDLPAVCGAAVATAVAKEALDDGVADGLAVCLGPVDAMLLEPGDVVRLADEDWRVERLEMAEAARATLSRVKDRGVAEMRTVWRTGEAARPIGTPLLAVVELPPLPGHETDDRPIVVVAAEPWRPMSVWAGGSVETSTVRATVLAPARVGTLVEALAPGIIGRWDEVNAIVVRVESAAPSSVADAAVLAGANAVAVETVAGWEVVQFRHAALIGPGLWRLTGLLRAQQGTEGEMVAGGVTGGLVVFLDEGALRADVTSDERGLPMIWSAGPRGGPAGWTGVTRQDVTLNGVHYRPFSPAHLRIVSDPIGLRLRWIARTRTGGDIWEGEPAASDPLRFRVRVLHGDTVVRVLEVDEPEMIYANAEVASDFPSGIGADARLGVAQADGRLGWGSEATVALVA